MIKDSYLKSLVIITSTLLISIMLNKFGIGKENVLMIFMVGVLLVTATTRGYRFGIFASLISVMLFNYFFTKPLHTFIIYSTNDLVLIFFFLIASFISSSLTARFQKQLTISQKNERTAKLLYKVAQRLLNVSGEINIVKQGVKCIKEYTYHESIVYLNGHEKFYSSVGYNSDDFEVIMNIPIKGLSKNFGLLKVIKSEEPLNIEHKWIINTVAAQMGIALDREFAYSEREKIKIAMEQEHLKSNLLRSISHDLRTPLTGIAGASSYILQKGRQLGIDDILNLTKDINEQSVWLTTLVENMLNMTRIDSGKLVIHKQLEVVEDVINEACKHVVGLEKRNFTKQIPDDLIAVYMDGKLIVQVIINLLNNAVTHTELNSAIKLEVNRYDNRVEFKISDSGEGINPSIKDSLFNSFVTSAETSADGKRGIGLGLAICKAIVKAHDGEICAGTSKLGGAEFTFTLPLKEI